MKEFIIMITVLFTLTIAWFVFIIMGSSNPVENTVPQVPLGKLNTLLNVQSGLITVLKEKLVLNLFFIKLRNNHKSLL